MCLRIIFSCVLINWKQNQNKYQCNNIQGSNYSIFRFRFYACSVWWCCSIVSVVPLLKFPLIVDVFPSVLVRYPDFFLLNRIMLLNSGIVLSVEFSTFEKKGFLKRLIGFSGSYLFSGSANNNSDIIRMCNAVWNM